MLDKRMENNRVHVNGKIVSGTRYSHEAFGESFYLMDISVKRGSGYVDIMPLMVSGRLLDTGVDHTGAVVSVEGQFRSYNCHEGKRDRLVLSIFVQEVGFLDREPESSREDNQILLKGFICKAPVYRNTPLGREVADILLAVNRMYGKSDYIPCIAWGKNARMAGKLGVGQCISIQGRVQSREYRKQLSEERSEIRVAYEVSASMLKVEAGNCCR